MVEITALQTLNHKPLVGNEGQCECFFALTNKTRINIRAGRGNGRKELQLCQTRGHAPLLHSTESELVSLNVVSVGAVCDDRNYSVTNAEP